VISSSLTTTEPILDSLISINSTFSSKTNSTIQIKNNATASLSNLTISTWIKPDYSQGSPEFTILSKENSFSLSLNNKLQPSKIATFSIYDGVKWESIESKNQIQEKWTNIISTYDGKTIKIYVDGQLEGTKKLTGVSSISVKGKLIVAPTDSIKSSSDIVIGASLHTKKSVSLPSNYFSGKIDDVQLFDKSLTDKQITDHYNQTNQSYTERIDELSIDEILAQIEAEMNIGQDISQSNNTTTIVTIPEITIIGNSTDLIFPDLLREQLTVNPQLTSYKETYLISENPEFNLEYFNESDSLMLEIAQIELSTDILVSQTEQSLNEIENQTSSQGTSTTLGFLFGLEKMLFVQFADAAKADDIEQLKIDLLEAKMQLEQIKSSINELKQQNSLDEKTINNFKHQLKDITEKTKNIAASLSKKNMKLQGDNLVNSVTDAENTSNLSTLDSVQKGKWKDNDTEVNVEVFDYSGKKVSLNSEIKQSREGKYAIKLLPDQSLKPGIYKVISKFTVNGEEKTAESQFVWGLVSLNTKKSIYKPGDVADFVIVVLDRYGHPTGNANLIMTITSPTGQTSTLSSNNEITSGDEI
ncbi:MAG: LamG domain-containing protein, partial [Nitrosarchaeum sp.]